ncbi:MAG: methylated-DNA--[protein]-cysteine S-methyltransferase [Candidatus Omnitrophota bacterium]
MNPSQSTAHFIEIESPIGLLLTACSDKSILAIQFGNDSKSDLTVWLESIGRIPSGEPNAVALKLQRELAEYFAGKRRRFTVKPELIGTDFQTKIWRALMEIPFGETVSYGELANRAGRPLAARAAGGACGKNRVPILIPCHRAIASGGGLGGFGGGLDVKRQLLRLEGAEF